MTIRKTLTAGAAVALALSLAACGGDDDDSGSENNGFESATGSNAATEETAADDGNLGYTELQFGDTATYKGSSDYPADVDIRVDDISVSNTCHDGVASYSDAGETPGSTYVKITGDLDVKSDAWGDSFYINVTDWVAVDAAGYSLEITPAYPCNGTGTDTWSNPLDAGQKRHAAEEFEVKGVPVQWGVKPTRSEEGWGWAVSAPVDASVGTPDPTPAA